MRFVFDSALHLWHWGLLIPTIFSFGQYAPNTFDVSVVPNILCQRTNESKSDYMAQIDLDLNEGINLAALQAHDSKAVLAKVDSDVSNEN
jgi:hypothetical protein